MENENFLQKAKWIAKYPSERILDVIAVAFSIAFYGMVFYIGVFADMEEAAELLTKMTGFDSEVVEYLLNVGADIALVLVIVMVISIVLINSSFTGKTLSRDIRLEDSKYEKTIEFFETNIAKLGFKNPPSIFITDHYEDSSILGVKIRSKHILVVEKAMLEKAWKQDNYDEAIFIIARRLSRISLGYNSIPNQVLTFWAMKLPVFNKVYKRSRAYTTDRMAMEIIGKERAVSGLVRSCYNVDLNREKEADSIALEKLIVRTSFEKSGLALENLSSEVPVAPYRVEALIRADEKKRRLFW